MSKPIYKFYMFRLTEAAYLLSQEEQQKMLAKHQEVMEKMGVKTIIACDSSWASDQFTYWGVEEFPDFETLQEFHRMLNEQNWFRYFEAETILGTRVEQ